MTFDFAGDFQAGGLDQVGDAFPGFHRFAQAPGEREVGEVAPSVEPFAMRQIALLVKRMATPLERDTFIGAQPGMMGQNHIAGFEIQKMKWPARI
jgi:hypothetical protein